MQLILGVTDNISILSPNSDKVVLSDSAYNCSLSLMSLLIQQAVIHCPGTLCTLFIETFKIKCFHRVLSLCKKIFDLKASWSEVFCLLAP